MKPAETTIAESHVHKFDDGDDSQKIKLLFDDFNKIEKALFEPRNIPESEAEHFSELIQKQSDLLFRAANTRASLIQDAALKLIMWRKWVREDVGLPYETMSLSDAIIYSTFRDLVKIFGLHEHLSEREEVI